MRRDNYNLNLNLANFAYPSSPYIRPITTDPNMYAYNNPTMYPSSPYIRPIVADPRLNTFKPPVPTLPRLPPNVRAMGQLPPNPNIYPSSPYIRPIVADPNMYAYNNPNTYKSSPIIQPIIRNAEVKPKVQTNPTIDAKRTRTPNYKSSKFEIKNQNKSNRLNNDKVKYNKIMDGVNNHRVNRTGTVKTYLKPKKLTNTNWLKNRLTSLARVV